MEKYEKIFCEYEKFWERTNKDRPILNVTYLKEGATGFRAPESIEEKWLSEEYRYNAYKHNLNVIGYTAEGVPMTSSNIGPGCLAGCIGGKYQLVFLQMYDSRHHQNTVYQQKSRYADNYTPKNIYSIFTFLCRHNLVPFRNNMRNFIL